MRDAFYSDDGLRLFITIGRGTACCWLVSSCDARHFMRQHFAHICARPRGKMSKIGTGHSLQSRPFGREVFGVRRCFGKWHIMPGWLYRALEDAIIIFLAGICDGGDNS